MRTALMLSTLFICLRAVAADPPNLEIRFCPADVARTYPLDSRNRVQGLLAPQIAIINHSRNSIELRAIHIELMIGERVVDGRHFEAADIQRFASNGAGIQEVAQAMPFMFCGADLITPGIKLAGPILGPGEGLIVMHEVFAFNEKRDDFRVRVEGVSAGRPVKVAETKPVVSGFSTPWLFPLRGVSYVGWGASFHTGHRWIWPQAFALDIARIGESGVTWRGDGARFSDYYAYGAEVHAAAAGKVVESANDAREDESLLQRPDEPIDTYTARAQESQARLLKTENGILGNYVLIEHGRGEYSLYAHLQPGSVRVRKGDSVAAGALLGKVGSSGNSTEPHLHFHVCTGSSGLRCSGVPVTFSNVKVLWAETERALQSGDIVIAK